MRRFYYLSKESYRLWKTITELKKARSGLSWRATVKNSSFVVLDEWRLHEIVSYLSSEFLSFCLCTKELGTILYGGPANGWIWISLCTEWPLDLYALLAGVSQYCRVASNSWGDQVCISVSSVSPSYAAKHRILHLSVRNLMLHAYCGIAALQIGDCTEAVDRHRPANNNRVMVFSALSAKQQLNSNRGTVFCMRSVPRCYKQGS
jgi:hypothetical protein